MFIIILIMSVLMSYQQDVNLSSSQGLPYKNLDYTISGRDYLSSFDPSSGKIYLFEKESQILISVSEESVIDTLTTIPQSYDGLDKMDVTKDGKSIYFWEKGIGRVHRYDIASKSIIREDLSHSHRTMYGHSALLSANNLIYAIGGYGYWEYRNMLIYYDPESRQWEKATAINGDIVIRSRSSALYKIANEFYYIVDDPTSIEQGKTSVYKYDNESNLWFEEREIEQIFENFKVYSFTVYPTFYSNQTYKIDPNNRHLGFLSLFSENRKFNLASVDESIVYQLDLREFGVYKVRDVIYSERINKWIILGHDLPSSRENRLQAFLFDFDENRSLLTVLKPTDEISKETLIFTAAGALSIGIFATLLFLFLKKRSDDFEDITTYETLDKKPVQLYKDLDGRLSVFIKNERFEISEDKAVKELWKVIAELVKSGESSILISKIDQRIYPDQSHPSQNSRNRKKLIKVINAACGFDLLSEERSKIDKRYKVLTIKIDKISINTV